MRLTPTSLPILIGVLCLLLLGGNPSTCDEIPGPSQGTNIAASANAKDDMLEALWAAVRNGDTKTITTLLDQGTDVNAKNKIGVTALWIAAGKGKQNVVELLVRHGADVNARDGIWYQTPLSSAVAEGNAEVVKFLIRSGATCTPATDGKRVVACFGSEGLYCYDFAGKLLWQRDLGTLDSSFAIDIKYEWGFGSSPILHDGLVILQCDLGKDSFIAAYRLEDGARVWSTPRDEIPSWNTPTIWRNARRIELVTNAAQYARGYDPATGKELWRLDKKSEVTIPTPIIGRDFVYLTSGNRPIQPIFAIRPGSAGDMSLKPNGAAQRPDCLEPDARRAVYDHADPLRRLPLHLWQRRDGELLPGGHRQGDL
jgi:hypothetical protein